MNKYLAAILLVFGFLFQPALAAGGININTATAVELEQLKGIGPAKAQAIVKYRQQYGAFKSLDDLQGVPGIGEKSALKLKNQINFSGAAAKTVKKVAKPGKLSDSAAKTVSSAQAAAKQKATAGQDGPKGKKNLPKKKPGNSQGKPKKSS